MEYSHQYTMEINQNKNELHLYPINDNEYIGAINVDGAKAIAEPRTVFVLDSSGSMKNETKRFVNEIFPLVMSKLDYGEYDTIDLIGFGKECVHKEVWTRSFVRKCSDVKSDGATIFAPAIKVLRLTLEKIQRYYPNKPIRVLTISDGAIKDHDDAENETKKLIEFLATSELTINSQAVRLFTSDDQPDTKASTYLLQINNTTATNLLDISATESDENIANAIAALFQSDGFQNNQILEFETSIVLKYPWNSLQSKRMTLVPGWNIFWLKLVPTGAIKLNDSPIKVIIERQLTLSAFHQLMDTKLGYIADHMKILKIVGTTEAKGSVDQIFEYFKKTENFLALKGSTTNNKMISNMLDGIAKNVTNFSDSAQMAEFLRKTNKEIEIQRQKEKEAREKQIEDENRRKIETEKEKARRKIEAEQEDARRKKEAEEKEELRKRIEDENRRKMETEEEEAHRKMETQEEDARRKLEAEKEEAHRKIEAEQEVIQRKKWVQEKKTLHIQIEDGNRREMEVEEEQAETRLKRMEYEERLKKEVQEEEARLKQEEEKLLRKQNLEEKEREARLQLQKKLEAGELYERKEKETFQLQNKVAASNGLQHINEKQESIKKSNSADKKTAIENISKKSDQSEPRKGKNSLITTAANKMRQFAGAIRSNRDNDLGPNPIQTVFILDENVCATKKTWRFTEKIIPLVFSKISYEKSQLTHLLTVVGDKSPVMQMLQSILQTLDVGKRVRILVLRNGNGPDRDEMENFTESLIKFISGTNFTFEFQVVRLASECQDSVIQIDDGAIKYQLFDIDAKKSNAFIATRVVELFNSKDFKIFDQEQKQEVMVPSIIDVTSASVIAMELDAKRSDDLPISTCEFCRVNRRKYYCGYYAIFLTIFAIPILLLLFDIFICFYKK